MNERCNKCGHYKDEIDGYYDSSTLIISCAKEVFKPFSTDYASGCTSFTNKLVRTLENAVKCKFYCSIDKFDFLKKIEENRKEVEQARIGIKNLIFRTVFAEKYGYFPVKAISDMPSIEAAALINYDHKIKVLSTGANTMHTETVSSIPEFKRQQTVLKEMEDED